MRGRRVHDTSAFGAGKDHGSSRNYIGAIAHSFSIADCFDEGCLAPARICYLRRDVAAVSDTLKDAVLLGDLKELLGVVANVPVQDPTQFWYSVSFEDGGQAVTATAHEFSAMAEVRIHIYLH